MVELLSVETEILIRNYRNVYGVMVLVAQEVAEVQG